MGRMVYRGAIPAAIGGIAIVLAVAIVGRVGAAGQRQAPGPGTPSAASAPSARRPSAPAAQRPTPARSTARVDYEREIKPILSENCLECHSQDKRKGGLSLATYGDVLDGGKDGAVIRPGNSSTSLITHRLTGQVGDRMPLDELPLSDAELAIIKQWIDQGARATPTSPAAPPPWDAPLALERPAVPPLVWRAWSRPLDRQVAAYLVKQKVVEPPLVSDTAFARRAYLEVWGLPPTPEALQAFVDDRAADKRERLVAALLGDNERYAEHW